jgi:3-dehydro-L-gulonate 2-dehydrogenase
LFFDVLVAFFTKLPHAKMESTRISSKDLHAEFLRVLIKYGFQPEEGSVCADVFVNNSIDGVYSHGVTRFPKFIRHLVDGHIVPGNRPILKSASGNLEQWDGQLGAGPVNALLSTRRAVALAQKAGIGCVALGNTNHWLRGGTYAWEATRAGCVFIGWSNTIANMPAWGATDAKLGNNPLVMGIPWKEEAIILDMAVSQYSYGALKMYDLRKEVLPVPGGYDTHNQLTTNPGEIRKSQRPLPIGYWKGAGLSLLLDILGTVLSGGLSTSEITKQGGEYNLSQVFIAIDLKQLGSFNSISAAIENIISDYHSSVAIINGEKIRYPGEKIVQVRKENIANGIPVVTSVWNEILGL